MDIAVLIVAGGNGSRVGSGMPKQFLPLAGKPVMVHTVETFRHVLPGAAAYIALSREWQSHWDDMAAAHGLGGNYRLCEGGETRYDTVRNALAVMEPCDTVLVHDAVRPLVSRELIERVLRCAAATGACVPVIEPVDSFRILETDGNSSPIERGLLRAVQTPQGFAYPLLRAAYDRPLSEKFTDDASVVESYGHTVTLCQGSPVNIKITYPEDLTVAGALLVEFKKN